MASNNFLPKIRFFSIGIVIFALIFVTKLFFVQVIHGSAWNEKADRQYATPASNIFDRGIIFFNKRDGQLVSAATIKAGFKVAIKPKEITDPDSVYEKLSEIIELDKESFIKKANKTDDPYEEIANRLSKDIADSIDALNIKGVNIYEEKWRFYPGSSLASHTLGFVAFKGDELAGRYGIERYYEDVLNRQSEDLYINVFAEIFLSLGKALFHDEKRDGDIITSIEPTVQNFLERELERTKEKWNAEKAAGIIINPMTGEIYALAAFPDFDINNFGEVENAQIFSNPFVENVFEFGSIIKPLTVAAGLDTGVITANTSYYDAGKVEVEIRTIWNFDKKGRGQVTIQDVLNQSLNTGAVLVSQKLGRDNMRKYFFAYGLGEKTNVDLPNETRGLVGNLDSKREIEFATASFGQGIAITPMEAVRAFSILANGGRMITPHLAIEIDYKEGGSKILEYPVGEEQIIKPETSDEITRMLVVAADESVLGSAEKLKHHSIAAKTGTAQIPDKINGGYSEYDRLHSIMGYYPAYSPQFLTLFYLEKPRGVKYSRQSLYTPFLDTAKFLLNYYEVPPDR